MITRRLMFERRVFLFVRSASTPILPVRAAEIGLNLIFPSRHNSAIHTGFSPIVREKYE